MVVFEQMLRALLETALRRSREVDLGDDLDTVNRRTSRRCDDDCAGCVSGTDRPIRSSHDGVVKSKGHEVESWDAFASAGSPDRCMSEDECECSTRRLSNSFDDRYRHQASSDVLRDGGCWMAHDIIGSICMRASVAAFALSLSEAGPIGGWELGRHGRVDGRADRRLLTPAIENNRESVGTVQRLVPSEPSSHGAEC